MNSGRQQGRQMILKLHARTQVSQTKDTAIAMAFAIPIAKAGMPSNTPMNATNPPGLVTFDSLTMSPRKERGPSGYRI